MEREGSGFDLMYQAGPDGTTTLKRVQPHRLWALIIEDLERYIDHQGGRQR